MAQNRSMAVKHQKAKKEAMKEAMVLENARSASCRYLTKNSIWMFRHPLCY